MPAKRIDIVTVIADLHTGSSTAIVPDKLIKDEGEPHYHTVAQAWLWSKWQEFQAASNALRPQGGGKRYLVVAGDLNDRPGNHNSPEFITCSQAIVHRAVIQLFKPIRAKTDYMFILEGTESHTETDEEDLARELCCVPDRVRGASCWQSLPLEVQGRLFEFNHHITMGQREWTRANSVNAMAADISAERGARGERIPDFAIFGHVHRFADSGRNYPIRVVTCPAWQLKSRYTRRVAATKLSHVGGLLFTITNGSVHMEEKLYFAPQRQPWCAEQENVR